MIGSFAAVVLLAAGTARAGTLYVNECSYYGNTAPAFVATSHGQDLNTPDECMVPSGTGTRSLEINTIGKVSDGHSAVWSTTTPSPAIEIVGVFTPLNQVFVDCALKANGYTAEYLWGNGGTVYGSQPIVPSPSGPSGSLCYGVGINRSLQPSRYFAWDAGCYLKSTCFSAADSGRLLGVRGIRLSAEEDSGPAITAIGTSNLWYHAKSWLRGSWPMSFTATDPSGVCATRATVGSQVIAGPGDNDPDQSTWQQCPNQVLYHQLDTTSFSNGSVPVTLFAQNAAGVASSPSERIYIDNQPVGLTLSGPTDVLSTARAQYVTARATAGPSGIGSIACSLDHGPMHSYLAAAARIAVEGLGTHHLSCIAHNRAVNSSDQTASSSVQSWTLSIRQPSVSTVSFARIADTLRCAKERERVRVPARWIVEHVHGHAVRVRIPAQTRTIDVVKCHPRVVRRRVWIRGRWVVKRVVVLPRTVRRSTKRVRFGATAVVSGWLGTSRGVALGGQRVDVVTAPDTGDATFKLAAVATSAADGTWSARLPPGPSRIIRALYGGSATVEPAVSGTARVIVPGSVRLSITPRHIDWGGTISIDGRLRGGNVPPSGEVVVLWISWRGGSTEIGHLYTRRDGVFRTTYTFLRGNGRETYRLWAATARESDYPYAPSRSRRVRVTVGT
jgi:hypothetical protein